MRIDVIGTEVYHDNWTETDPGSEIYDVADYINDNWNWYLDSDYEVTTIGYALTEIPEGPLTSNVNDSGDVSDRREDIHDWLLDNYSRYDDFHIEAIIVLDYVEGSSVPLGQATLGTAGRDGWFFNYNRVGWVNMEAFPRGSWSYHSETQHYGTAVHELQHLYDVQHSHGGRYNLGEGSFVLPANHDGGVCFDNSDPDVRGKRITLCSQDVIEDHTDSHIN